MAAAQPPGGVFGDDVVAAIIERLVHPAEAFSLAGGSYRLQNRGLGRAPAAETNA
ncbi:hypothetical protein IU476_06005 [Nocardia blacklockiae]|nr:hypothetical protein [Nocardia blacklockiae]